jgi:hypothetical protein
VSGIAGYFLVDSINEALTVNPQHQEAVELEYGLASSPSATLGQSIQCQPRHTDGTPLEVLAQPSVQFFEGALGFTSGLIGGTWR